MPRIISVTIVRRISKIVNYIKKFLGSYWSQIWNKNFFFLEKKRWFRTFFWLLLNNTMNTIQHNNTIQFPQKTLKFYKIVLCYCVVLCCCCFFCFFLIVPKTTQWSNTIHATIYSFFWKQYNTITKYNFCKKTLNFTKLYCVIMLYCVVGFFLFFKIVPKTTQCHCL